MSGTERSRIKIGTGDFRGRVISGSVTDAEPASIRLRLLYPEPPVDIGVIDQVEDTGPVLTIFPEHRSAWTEPDRTALTAFFTDRFGDHSRLAALLNIAAVLGSPSTPEHR